MADQYLIYNNTYTRLFNEWIKHGKIIIAYDFDSTVYDTHKQGNTYYDVQDLLRYCKRIGAYFIVFTANGDTEFIKKHLAENELPFDKINDNLHFINTTGRKIYYNILLDDRAGLSSAYETLYAVSRCMFMYRKTDAIR